MSCRCYIIPKYLEDRINTKFSDVTPRTSEISTNFRSQRETLKSRHLASEQSLVTSYTSKNHVYTAKNTQRLPGTLVASSMSESTINKDIDVIGAWTLADYFSRFLREILKRNSFDGMNGTIKSTVHYYRRYNNAFFDGSQMICGDGDDIICGDFAQDPSVVFHELWHGVTDRTCKLEYHDQSGSLNESLSDVFASIILQWINGETIDEASWLIGERCIIDIDQVPYALRSLSDPGSAYINHPYMGTDDQPQDMTHYYNGSEDNGGVHINSGIPNHAFYLFAKSIGGYSWDIPCKIWYKTITTEGLLSSTTTFVEFAQATITIATELYASSKPEIIDKLRNAWQNVKVL